CGDGPYDLDLAALAIDGDFGTGRDVAPLFGTARDPKAAALGWLVILPAELFGGGRQDGPQPLVARVLQPEFERLNAGGVGQVVDVALAVEAVGGVAQGPVRALLERRARAA